MGLQVARRFGEAAGSVVCFLAVLAALVAVDDRVRERIALAVPDGQVATWSEQARVLASVLFDAARDQSIAHAPLLIFTCVAILLVLFMLRT